MFGHRTHLQKAIVYVVPAWTDPAEAVEAGREALDPWWGGYPWYDAQSDGIRRVALREPMDWSWLWDWLPSFGSGTGSWWNSALGWVFWTAVILLLAWAVYLLVRAYRQRRGFADQSGRGTEAGQHADGARRIEALPVSLQRDLNLLEETRTLYRQGKYGLAIIYLFSHELIQLDQRHLIRLAKGKTNRRYLRELASHGRLRQLLEQTMVAFEDVFFGNRALDRRRFESCWTRLEEFQSLAAEAQ